VIAKGGWGRGDAKARTRARVGVRAALILGHLTTMTWPPSPTVTCWTVTVHWPPPAQEIGEKILCTGLF
jgi:hypothetical protein